MDVAHRGGGARLVGEQGLTRGADYVAWGLAGAFEPFEVVDGGMWNVGLGWS